MTHLWRGLPLGELTPEKCEALLAADGGAAAAAAAAEGDAEAAAEPDVSDELSSNMTRAHRSVVSARDRVYAAYRLHYAGRVKAINAACEQALSDERQWTANWKQLVNRAAIEPIYSD